MWLKKWEELPDFMRTKEVRPYYDSLKKKQRQLILKRIFDIICSLILIIILSPVLLIVSIWIKCDSKGPVFYRQERVTQYGKIFRIFKFRTMVTNADKIGSLVTIDKDPRITKVGEKIRKCRLDEIPQLFNVLKGEMTLVGTRPEVKKYVDAYTNEMYATLLLPAGVTSLASIEFKDEDHLLAIVTGIDLFYTEKILPKKMIWNLKELKEFSLKNDVKLMLITCIVVLGKKYEVMKK